MSELKPDDARVERPRSVRRVRAVIGWTAAALAVLFVLIVFGWWRSMAPRRAAVERIRRLDPIWGSFPAGNDSTSDRAAWWERLLLYRCGLNSLAWRFNWAFTAESTTLPQNATDDDLLALTAFPELRTLEIYGPQRITARGFDCLERFKQMEYLTIRSQTLDDETLAKLASLPKLESLEVSGCKIDGSGFESWPASPRFRNLNASDTRFDDRALRLIESRFPNLERLELSNCRVFLTPDWEELESPPLFPKLKAFHGGLYATNNMRLRTTNRRVGERFKELHPGAWFP